MQGHNKQRVRANKRSTKNKPQKSPNHQQKRQIVISSYKSQHNKSKQIQCTPLTSTSSLYKTKNNKKSPNSISKRGIVNKFDPLNKEYFQRDPTFSSMAESTFISSRSADRPISVLLAGYSSLYGQHLYTHLLRYGLQVIPVDREQSDISSRVQVLSYDQIREQGIPDVDFIVNCVEQDIYVEWTQGNKNYIESSRLETNQFWTEQIRKTRSKPYAFIGLSSALIYPSSKTDVYDETYTFPMAPLPSEASRPELQAQELSLPYWTRFWRNTEEYSRVFIPEIDIVSSTELDKYRQHQKKLLADEASSYQVLSNESNTSSPSQLRKDSLRRDLLSNEDVRVINIRLGHCLARSSYESALFDKSLYWGLLPIVGDGKTIHPWIHMDDAMEMIVFSMFNHEINGPINAVAPYYATNAELNKFLVESHRSWNYTWSVKPETVLETYGNQIGSIFTTERKVLPQKASTHGFKWQYPTIWNATYEGRLSLLDKEVMAAGSFENIRRNIPRNVKTN